MHKFTMRPKANCTGGGMLCCMQEISLDSFEWIPKGRACVYACVRVCMRDVCVRACVRPMCESKDGL